MQRRIDSLTSLRFIAAAIVALQHAASPAFFKVGISLFDTRQAVSFFFVLSGFVLVHAYWNFDARNGLGDFIAARLSRLWPAHAATAILAAVLVAPVTDMVGVTKFAVNLLLLQSWIPLTQWYYSINGVSWSISSEMFFYLMFPIALMMLRRNPLLVAVVSVCLVCVGIAIASALQLSSVEASPGMTAWGILYISPITRLAEFLGGMVAYQVAISLRGAAWSRAQASAYEIAGVVISFLAMVGATKLSVYLSNTSPQAAVWIRVAGSFPVFAALLSVFYAQRGIVSRLLSWRPLVYLGEISFALYLLHQLVLRWMFGHYRDIIETNWWLAYCGYWVVSIAGAAAIYHWIETPAREPLRDFVRRRYSKFA